MRARLGRPRRSLPSAGRVWWSTHGRHLARNSFALCRRVNVSRPRAVGLGARRGIAGGAQNVAPSQENTWRALRQHGAPQSERGHPSKRATGRTPNAAPSAAEASAAARGRRGAGRLGAHPLAGEQSPMEIGCAGCAWHTRVSFHARARTSALGRPKSADHWRGRGGAKASLARARRRQAMHFLQCQAGGATTPTRERAVFQDAPIFTPNRINFAFK